MSTKNLVYETTLLMDSLGAGGRNRLGDVIAMVRAEERERCAKVAEDDARCPHDLIICHCAAGAQIAKRIRGA